MNAVAKTLPIFQFQECQHLVRRDLIVHVPPGLVVRARAAGYARMTLVSSCRNCSRTSAPDAAEGFAAVRRDCRLDLFSICNRIELLGTSQKIRLQKQEFSRTLNLHATGHFYALFGLLWILSVQ